MAETKPTENKRSGTMIPLTDIHADHNWNARGSHWATTATEEDTGFDGLVESIELRGQDEPVVVRPNPDPKSKQKYSLVAGYRRFEAITKIAIKENNKTPSILAEVRALDELGARALNTRENTARESLSPQDLTYAISLMAASGANDSAIARELAKTPSYISQLHRIGRDTVPKIFVQWRDASKPLTVTQMLQVCKTPKLKEGETESESDRVKRQTEIYKELTEALNEREREKSDDEKDAARLEGLKTKAEGFGFVLGQLHAMDFLKSDTLDFAECLDFIVKVPSSGFDGRKRKSVASAAEKGWKEGVKAIEDAPDEEEEEEEAE